ncbi:DMT family transporter [Breoghania sp.]|uniref:DMT family transporter n=1 Tax=Breoghania sp. TaxID=2065378 RepID=UPI00260E6FDA|nr:DMT family transporter [Breoghania sp.]MDJ0931217.1 DMT family transporter [Breoghania sp.]
MTGISLKVLSTITFTLMSAIIKLIIDEIPTGEVVFARNFLGMIPVFVMMAAQGQLPVAIKTRRPLGHFLRAIIGVTAMSLNFAALAFIPLPDATAIGYAAPLLTVVMAVFILKEIVGVYRWSAVGVGFVGVVIILAPNLGSSQLDQETAIGASLALTATLFMAGAAIIVRKLITSERSATIVLWFSASSSVLALTTIPLEAIWPSQTWVMPEGWQWGMIVATGLLGGLGQILMTTSYRFADASTIAPFDYTTIIWATALGWVMFDEVPGPTVIAGAAVVIAAGLFVLYREQHLGIDRTRSRCASTPSKS